MSTIFDALPGQDTPVGSISKNLARMWATEENAARPGEESKATQVNFVLHLGIHTTSEDAVLQFQTAVKFSQRYPCRVVVLCPIREENVQGGEIRAKIYGECHPGKTRGDLRCCEFVLLSYPLAARQFLENQVSTCLSTDLPLYYWAHNFTSSANLSAYQYLLSKAKRVLVDGPILADDAPSSIPWPRPENVRDLVQARLLPVRQSIGQFLSGFRPAQLTTGVSGVEVRHGLKRGAEAQVLAAWAQPRLLACGAADKLPFSIGLDDTSPPDSITLQFWYNNGQAFRFFADFLAGSAEFTANFGEAKSELVTAIHLLPPEAALAEAMFF
jgi:Glucose-6-phosphate dehydrogenase subunit